MGTGGATSGVGSILGIAGGIINSYAAAKEQKDMNWTYGEEEKLQQRYADYGQSVFDQGLAGSGYAGAQQMMAKGKQDRLSEYAKLGKGSGITSLASPIKLTDVNLSKVALESGQQAQSRAQLGSYSDWLNQQTINNLNTQRELDRISNYSSAWAKNVFPYEMYDASKSQSTLSSWGSLLGSVGSSLGGGSGGSGSDGSSYSTSTNDSIYYPNSNSSSGTDNI